MSKKNSSALFPTFLALLVHLKPLLLSPNDEYHIYALFLSRLESTFTHQHNQDFNQILLGYLGEISAAEASGLLFESKQTGHGKITEKMFLKGTLSCLRTLFWSLEAVVATLLLL